MKLRRPFIFVLFLAIVGLIAVAGQAHAGGSPKPAIQITFVGAPDDALEMRGTLTGTAEQPALIFIFISVDGNGEFDVPVMSTDWSASTGGQRWVSWLDLRGIPDGAYSVMVRASLSNGTSVTDTLTGDPGDCPDGICIPGGLGETPH